MKKLKGGAKAKADESSEKSEKMHTFYKRVSNLMELLVSKILKVFSGESLAASLYRNFNKELEAFNTTKDYSIDFIALKKQVELINEKILTIGTTHTFKFIMFNFIEQVYNFYAQLAAATQDPSNPNKKMIEKFYQAIFVLQALVYDKFPRKTEEFFQAKGLLEKMSQCVKKQANLEVKSYGLFA